MKTIQLLVLASALLPVPVFATERLEFSEIWKRVKVESPEVRASDAEWRASESAASRSSRHWIPNLSLTGRGIHTNDPAQIFFSRLGQRALETTDFAPSALNQPGSANFLSTSLGMQWSLFEGGAGVAHRNLQHSMADMMELTKDRTEWETYVDAASSYATILHAQSTRQVVMGLESQVRQVLAKYSVGSKSNPVGYSGLLGLKSLLNRAQAVSEQLWVEGEGARSRISSLASSIPPEFEVRPEPVAVFLAVALPEERLNSTESLPVTIAEKRLEVSRAAIGLDRARALPQIGVFGEGGMVSGARNTGAAYAGGLYLRWNLFDPRDLGSLAEKKLEQDAAQARLEGARASLQSGREAGFRSLNAIQNNEKRLNESLVLMSEQVEVASRLFQSGSIGALQLAEIYNRRLDLILNHQEIQRQHIQARAALARLASGKEANP